MKLVINREQRPLMSNAFYRIIEQELADVDPKDGNAIILNFRDPDYSAENGGFHPVEVCLEKQQDQWGLVYVTDFAFLGQPYPELIKEVDICFACQQVYGVYCGWLDAKEGRELLELFNENFACYAEMDVYKVSVTLH